MSRTRTLLVALPILAGLLHAPHARADDEEEPAPDATEEIAPPPMAPSESTDTTDSGDVEPATGVASEYAASEPEPTSDELDAVDNGSKVRMWFGGGYFRTAAHTRRGPVINDDVLPVLGIALDVNRHGYSIEATSTGLNDTILFFSRWGKLSIAEPGERHRHYDDGAPREGLVLRVRFVKYVARGAKSRFGAGFILADLRHVAGRGYAVAIDDVPKVQDAWFIVAGPMVRFDRLMTAGIQARFGATVGFGIVDLKDKDGRRPYPISAFGQLRFRNSFFVGLESSVVVGVADVFTQRYELQVGFVK